MVIVWPDRSVTKINKPVINTVHTFNQADAAIDFQAVIKNTNAAKPLLEIIPQSFDKHIENEYIDFYEERNIPMMLSKEGPKAAVGDVNGDGLPDIYIGGTAGNPGQLYIQTAGGFVKKEQEDFKRYAVFEDIATLFFDCDGDGDLDLFVGSGGNDHPSGSWEMQNRLYRNDGKGNFVSDSKALPFSGTNNAVVLAADFDGDGDLDLFAGSRSIPQRYGPSPNSFIYINDGKGNFIDIAKTKNQDISVIGLVTGAVWTDVTGDRKEDLVIVGEWMAPRIFSFKEDRFVEIKTNLSDMHGWWQSVAAMDVDDDGDNDLVLGNFGENFYLRPDASAPVKLWINDFDNNGTIDKIITRTVAGKDVTIFLKKEITDQIASLRKNNFKYEEFATKSIQQLFTPEVLKKSVVKTFNYASSAIAINDGKGNFQLNALPPEVQFSCVNTILCTDVNFDGKTDLIIGGNKFDFLPQFGRLDANAASVLLNDGKGKFKFMESSKSGLRLEGQVRDIKLINGKEEQYILLLRNNDYPFLYRINNYRVAANDSKINR